MLSTSRFDDAGITMHVVKRTQQGASGPAVSYCVEVASDQPRPQLVLHWAVNDWALPAQVGGWAARLGGWGWQQQWLGFLSCAARSGSCSLGAC